MLSWVRTTESMYLPGSVKISTAPAEDQTLYGTGCPHLLDTFWADTMPALSHTCISTSVLSAGCHCCPVPEQDTTCLGLPGDVLMLPMQGRL